MVPGTHLIINEPKRAFTINTGMPKKISQQEVISRAITVHRDSYGYHLFDFKGMHTKTTIVCKEHGPFEQTPDSHIRQQRGCPKCGMQQRILHNKSTRLTTSEFIKKAEKIHNHKYSYQETEYINATTPIIIICPEHGGFAQRPTDHIHKKTGCPICSLLYKTKGSGVGTYTNELFVNNPELASAPGVLYLLLLKDANEQFLKIGITKRTIRERLWNMPGYAHQVLLQEHLPLIQCFNYEQHILKTHSVSRFYSNNKTFIGKTELFKVSAKDTILTSLYEIINNR